MRLREPDCCPIPFSRAEGYPAVTKIRTSLTALMASSVSALALAAAMGPAQAQEAASDGRVDTIIVTTNRREENIQDVAASVTALSDESFDAITEGGADILSLAARVPSLYAESSNGRVAPRFYIRGLGNTDFDLAASQPVSIVMDDIVQENVILKSFPLFDIESVEVSRGPQGTLFGRNTTAGIIKFDSARPGHDQDGYVSATIGNLGTVNAEGAANISLSENMAMRVSLFTQNRGNWIDNGFLNSQDALGGFNEYAGRVQLLVTPSDNFDVLFNVHARSLEGTSAVFRANILTTGSNALNANYDRNRVFYDSQFNNPQEYGSWGASIRANLDLDGMTLTSITGFETAGGFSLGDIDGGNLSGPGFIPFPSETQDVIDTIDQYTQEIRLASDTSGATSWQVGAYWFSSEFDITTLGPNGGFPPPTTVRHTNDLWSFFGQASHQVNDRLQVSGGLRYTSDEKDLEVPVSVIPQAPVSASDEQVSWDLSAIYDLDRDVSVFARVARGFRGPTIQARDVAFFGAPSVADSETVLSWEAGIKSEPLGGRARVNATAFYYTVEDLQLSAVGGAGNLVQLVNAAEGVGYGLELDAEYLVSDNLLVTAGFSLNETELQDPNLEVAPCGSGQCTPLDPDADNDGFVEVDGNPFPQAPDYILSLTARYSIPAATGGEWFVFTDWFWQGRTNLFLYESEEFYSDGNFEGGLRAGYAGNNGGRDWEAAVFVRNITDEDNLVGGIDFNNNTGFVNDPRIWGVSLRTDLN